MSLSKNKITLIIISFLVLVFLIVYNSIYLLPEGQISIAHSNSLQNETHSNTVLLQRPGLHLRLPFLRQPTEIDMRLQSFSQKSSILTADSQALLLDYYVKWKIVDPILYYRKTQNDTPALQQQLTQAINTLLEKQCAHNTLNTISHDQASLLNTILVHANTQSKTLGITLVGIGFTAINYPKEANTQLLKNMRAKQTQLALEQHAIAKANAENIRNKADNQASLLLAKAKEEAAIIRGQGDAEAAKIYSTAYHKNPQFAAFYINLEAYRKAFTQSPTQNNFLVLNSKGNFFNVSKELPQSTKESA